MVSESSKGVKHEMSFTLTDELLLDCCCVLLLFLRQIMAGKHTHTHARVCTRPWSMGSVLVLPSCPEQLNVRPDLAGCALQAGGQHLTA